MLMIRPTKEDIKCGLLSFLGRDFYDSGIEEQEELIEVFHSIVHDDIHPINILKSKTLEKNIRRGVSAFLGRRDKIMFRSSTGLSTRFQLRSLILHRLS